MSSLKDLASLIMIPSLVKDNRLDTVKPLGNGIIHPDSTGKNDGTDGSTPSKGNFTFARGSNLAATRVNAAGLIEKGRENLLLQSNQFDTTWIKNNGSSFASGKEGYDGTNNAWQFNVSTTTNSAAYQQFSFSGVGTFSAYFKKGTIDKVAFANFAGSAYECWFDLTNGTIGQQTGDLIDAKIVSVGDGWYRCSITDLNNGNSYFQLKPSNAFSTASTAGHIFIQNAQLESGLVATDYIPTITATGKVGILEDLPRLDYSGGATCPSLILEPLRTNLVQFSEHFGASYWTKSGSSIVSNNAISPDGNLNASKLVEGSNNGIHFINVVVSVSNATQYTSSIFVKSAERKKFGIRDGFSNAYVTINLIDGSIISSNNVVPTPKITKLKNDWYEISYTFQTAATSATLKAYPLPDSYTSGSPETYSYQGDGTSGVYIYGAQFELGNSQTSYIPTYGTSVTRSKDACSSSSVSISSTDFTIFFEAKDFCLINGRAGGSYANIQFVFSPTGGAYDSGGSYHIYANSLYYWNGVTNTSFGVIFNSQTDSKFALVKRGNKGIIYANGVKKTEITLPSGADAKVINWDTIDLTQSLQDAQGDVFGSNYKQLIKFNTALSDSELASLTTI